MEPNKKIPVSPPEQDDFWGPTRRFGRSLGRALTGLSCWVRRLTPLLLLILLIVELSGIYATIRSGTYSVSFTLYVRLTLAAASCIGLGASAAGGHRGPPPPPPPEKREE